MNGCNADLGLSDMTFDQAVDAGAKTLVIGVANRGGVISAEWKAKLIEALEAGLDIASGLHNLLKDEKVLVDKAEELGRSLFDVRIPTEAYPIASGIKRTGKRCLAVGTDCSVGKMYTGLAIEKEMLSRNIKATFRSTGQTGILITGNGVPLDAVIADFMAGSVEHLTPDNDENHWDLIEGQGSLYHASYSGVTMALIHGGQPDALILCHEPTREHMRGLPDFKLPSLDELRDTALIMAKIVNPNVKVVGISVNTQHLDEVSANEYLSSTEQRMGIPAVDPFRHGAARLVDALEAC
ncbi:DUF1611 domain-containing protein, partial [Amylibacter sp.]|jgi:uncharacterized NAD-dependent epimerase/dehydratase family protein|nr:DUF1611 domain-containing protein [Amylibacter sp.]